MEEPDNLLRGPQTPVSTVRTMKNPLYLSTGPPAYNDIGPVNPIYTQMSPPPSSAEYSRLEGISSPANPVYSKLQPRQPESLYASLPGQKSSVGNEYSTLFKGVSSVPGYTAVVRNPNSVNKPPAYEVLNVKKPKRVEPKPTNRQLFNQYKGQRGSKSLVSEILTKPTTNAAKKINDLLTKKKLNNNPTELYNLIKRLTLGRTQGTNEKKKKNYNALLQRYELKQLPESVYENINKYQINLAKEKLKNLFKNKLNSRNNRREKYGGIGMPQIINNSSLGRILSGLEKNELLKNKKTGKERAELRRKIVEILTQPSEQSGYRLPTSRSVFESPPPLRAYPRPPEPDVMHRNPLYAPAT